MNPFLGLWRPLGCLERLWSSSCCRAGNVGALSVQHLELEALSELNLYRRNYRSSLKNDEVLDLLRLKLPPVTPPTSIVGTASNRANELEDGIYPLDHCIFACSSTPIKIFENNKGRPHRTIFLPRRQQSINFLLDSGANVNVLNFLTCLHLLIPIRRDPTGHIGRICGKTPSMER